MQREQINSSIYSVSLSPIHKFTFLALACGVLAYSCVFWSVSSCLFVSLRVSSCASCIYTLSTGTWLGRQPCRHYFVGSVCSAPRHDVRCWGEEIFSVPSVSCWLIVDVLVHSSSCMACLTDAACCLPPTPSNRCPLSHAYRLPLLNIVEGLEGEKDYEVRARDRTA